MQFSVPQFTDVEDRIVGGLTFKQFGIVFAAGIFVFFIYTLSKNLIATIIAAIVLGIPALAISFGKINGRPIYSAFGPLMGFLTGGKIYVFHKEARTVNESGSEKVEVVQQPAVSLNNNEAVTKLKKLNYVLQQQATAQQALLDQFSASRK